MNDHLAVMDLLNAYAYAIDERDWDALRDCFVELAVVEMPASGQVEGSAEIVATLQRALSKVSATQHCITNVRVSFADATGEASCYVRSQHVRVGCPGGETFMVGGRYFDTVVKADGRWRIARRRLDVVWTDGNRSVLGWS